MATKAGASFITKTCEKKIFEECRGIDDQWDMDLMDMTKYAKENDGIHLSLK